MLLKSSHYSEDSCLTSKVYSSFLKDSVIITSVLLKLQCIQESPWDLLQIQILIQYNWERALDSAFLTGSHVLIPLLLVLGPHWIATLASIMYIYVQNAVNNFHTHTHKLHPELCYNHFPPSSLEITYYC